MMVSSGFFHPRMQPRNLSVMWLLRSLSAPVPLPVGEFQFTSQRSSVLGKHNHSRASLSLVA